jgi:NTP pyrophosphatase (non-canonical NTP hydrolase)
MDTANTNPLIDPSTGMGLETLRLKLAEFAKSRDWEQFHSIRNLVLALVGEVGELAAEFQWLNDEQVETAMLDTHKREAIGSELADILAYLIRIADVAQFDLESELMKKMKVNESRYPIEKTKGSSAKYTAYD